MKQETVHVGIDVSKLHLDIAPFDGGAPRVGNDHTGIRSLIRRFKRFGAKVVACCEATGGLLR